MERQENPQISAETCLEDVMEVILYHKKN